MYAKIGVQVCIFALGWALQSPNQLCKSFSAPIFHFFGCWALHSPGYMLFHMCQTPWQHLAHAYNGREAGRHGVG